MKQSLMYKVQKEEGFTLVELAIVMIIIGLLIGGILKGQELVSNAEVAASVSQLKTVDAAISTFQDAYNSLPGDMSTPATRIPACAGTCARVGDANGRITETPGAAQALAMEATTFWSQLSAANIIGGIVSAPGALTTGESHPEFPVNGAMRFGYNVGGAVATGGTQAAGLPTPAGHYVNTTLTLNAIAGTVAANPLTPGEAFRIDSKIDDSRPNTGTVLAVGSVGAGTTNCVQANTAVGEYSTAQTGLNCGIYVRMQN